MKYPNHWKYVCKVRLLLLGAGMEGLSFHQLNQKTRTKVFHQDHLRELLNEWELREWVQCFVVPNGRRGRNPTMWRATTLLQDSWVDITIDGSLPQAPAVEVEVDPPGEAA